MSASPSLRDVPSGPVVGPHTWADRCPSCRRLARLGEGSVIGGKVALSIDGRLAGRLATPMTVALVSGTNGKTTTTTLLALGLAVAGPTATNKQGANLASGLTGALLASPDATFAALEVDEAVLPWALRELHPRAVALLNLSRDQLDRLHEVRATAERWRRALATGAPPLVVANADDPLVAWAVDELAGHELVDHADGRSRVVWVAAGLAWQLDSSACPWCEADLEFTETAWRCLGCGRVDTHPSYSLSDGSASDGSLGDGVVVDGDGAAHPLGLSLPGRSARANAAMAFAVIDQLGLPTEPATARWGDLRSIEGRYQHVHHRGAELVLHLAKNPAGWADLLDLVARSSGPLVLVLNAQGQDGRDPSWIWDVPFEQLAGRRAYCLGERGLDLAVRLDYAGLDVTQVADLDAAVDQLVAEQRGAAREASSSRWTSSPTTAPSNRSAGTCPTRIPAADDRHRTGPSRTCWAPTATAATRRCWPTAWYRAASRPRWCPSPLAATSPIRWPCWCWAEARTPPSGPCWPTPACWAVWPGPRPGTCPCWPCAPPSRCWAWGSRSTAGAGRHRAARRRDRPPGPPGGGRDAGATRTRDRRRPGCLRADRLREPRRTHPARPGLPSAGSRGGRRGNGDGTDGAVTGHVVGTYLHGPVLARNPALADQLLTWAVGELEPLSIEVVERLHDERVAASARERRATDQIDAANEAGPLAGVRYRMAGVGARMGAAVSEATRGRRGRGASRG